MYRKVLLIIMVMVILLIVLNACAPGTRYSEERKAGFFWGIWHGWIAPVSLIWQLFNSSVRIYEVNNTGWWYDFGFYMALIGGFGGLSIIRRKKS